MIKTHRDVVKYIEQFIPTPEKKHPGKFGLDRMREFMTLLGNPQDRYPVIHVAGTSGKGSTATMIAALLATHLRVGLTTSPHLERINERIVISGVEISDEAFVSLFHAVIPAIETMQRSSFGPPSYFEILAGMAFLHFAIQKVDVTVVEVGLGGKFDGTNVVNGHIVALTSIGLDHTDILGKTRAAILREKCGIIKQGSIVISGITDSKLRVIVTSTCKKRKAILLEYKQNFSSSIISTTEKGSVFNYHGVHHFPNISLSLLGEHQVRNAIIAIQSVEACQRNSGIFPKQSALSQKDVKRVLASIRIPGRMELVRSNPPVLLDGAHNGEKARALARAIHHIFLQTPIITLLSIKEGKLAPDILKHIASFSRTIILTRFQLVTDLGDTRSFAPEKLHAMMKQQKIEQSIEIVDDPTRAFHRAQAICPENGMIVLTGSLYFVGVMRSRILKIIE